MNKRPFNEVSNTHSLDPQTNTNFSTKYFPESNSIINTLNEMFPEQTYEDKTFKKAKEILGNKYTDEEVRSLIASYEYLINNWLEEYEKRIFDNQTLKELLQDL